MERGGYRCDGIEFSVTGGYEMQGPRNGTEAHGRHVAARDAGYICRVMMHMECTWEKAMRGR